MNKNYYAKDDIIVCPECNTEIAKFKRDMYSGETLCSKDLSN